MIYTLFIIFIVISVVITYIITKLKFEKKSSAQEEKMRSSEIEKQEKEKSTRPPLAV